MDERENQRFAEQQHFRVNIPEHPEEAWWFTPHPLVINTNPTFVVPPSEELYERSHRFFDTIAGVYQDAGCPVFWADHGELHTPTATADEWGSTSDSSHGVILHPIFFGNIPKTTLATLHLMQSPIMHLLEGTKRFDSVRHQALRVLAHSLPERGALVKEIGRPIVDMLGLDRKIHPNYVNVFFVDNDDTDLRKLPIKGRQGLQQALMAKFGGFKNIVVPRSSDESELAILASLEGGHPELSPKEIGRRLLLFGSTEAVGGHNVAKDRRISPEEWKNSSTVRGIQEMGRFAGKKRLFSPPAGIKHLMKDPRLAAINERVAGFAQQAEGAMLSFDPDLGVYDMTATGKFKTVKTKLQPEDLLALSPSEDGLSVDVTPVGNGTPKPPSVEARQLLLAIEAMRKYFPELRISRENGGYRKNPEGEIAVPIVRAVLHVHRMYEFDRESPNIIEVHDDSLPVGCGVDLMDTISHDAMVQAVQQYVDQRQQAAIALQYVGNHGTDMIVFWKANEKGIIPEDPFYFPKEMIKRGELRFNYEIPQV